MKQIYCRVLQGLGNRGKSWRYFYVVESDNRIYKKTDMIQFDLTLEADHWVQMKETYIYNSANIHCVYTVSSIALDIRSKTMTKTDKVPPLIKLKVQLEIDYK